MKPIELYIHIPFCVKKCNYCDFLSGASTAAQREQYTDALCKEIRSYHTMLSEYEVTSIFFGGGTPSILPVSEIDKIMEAVRSTCSLTTDCEITIECNPGTVDYDKMSGYHELGINRISFGLQSTDNKELVTLGRIHTYEQFLSNYKAARDAGFSNINVDLMSALPYQSLASYEQTLTRIANLKPEHISAYSLIIEEGTQFFERFGEGKPEESALPDEELDRKMYEKTKEILADYGYHRYEISNYAKEGYECRHNAGYWKRTEYLGCGLGASSFYQNQRWHNETDMDTYLKAAQLQADIRCEVEVLDQNSQMEEFMFLGLRMCEGIKASEFEAVFHTTLKEVYEEPLDRLVKEGLLVQDNDRYYLSEYGLDVSNSVFAEFIL